MGKRKYIFFFPPTPGFEPSTLGICLDDSAIEHSSSCTVKSLFYAYIKVSIFSMEAAMKLEQNPKCS